jgi:hypothetical protein
MMLAAEDAAPAAAGPVTTPTPTPNAEDVAEITSVDVTPPGLALRVELLQEKLRVQAELLRAKDEQIKHLHIQLSLANSSNNSSTTSNLSSPSPSVSSSSSTPAIAPSRSSSPTPTDNPVETSTSPSPSAQGGGGGGSAAAALSGAMLEHEAASLHELLVRYDQLEKALIEVAVTATKVHTTATSSSSSTSIPIRKQPSGNLRNLRVRRRSGRCVSCDMY